MSNLLYNKLDAAHPVITKQENDLIITLSEEERIKTIAEWTSTIVDNAWLQLRQERNMKLNSCDWTQTVDSQVDLKAWAEYRQALRDFPAAIEDPTTPIIWPSVPG